VSRSIENTGVLKFDPASGRYVLVGRELHCGDCFQVYWLPGVSLDAICWHDVRIEHNSEGWYLIGLPGAGVNSLEDLPARFYR
jgi:hypothetical protein